MGGAIRSPLHVLGEEIVGEDMHRPDQAGNVDPDIIQEPIVSCGRCLNARRCQSYHVILGDGLCQWCWDRVEIRKAQWLQQ